MFIQHGYPDSRTYLNQFWAIRNSRPDKLARIKLVMWAIDLFEDTNTNENYHRTGS